MEIWKDVKGYEGFYQISNQSRIKGLNGNGNGTVKILKGHSDKDGYIKITLCKNSKYKYVRLHRLIAEHFIPNPENKSEVNHINGVKYDNRIENLEWCTPSENRLHYLYSLGGYEKLNMNGTIEWRKLNANI